MAVSLKIPNEETLEAMKDVETGNNYEDINLEKNPENKSLRGVFQSYADPEKQLLEDDTWKNHVLEKYKRNMDEETIFDEAELLNRVNDIKNNTLKPLSRKEVFDGIC